MEAKRDKIEWKWRDYMFGEVGGRVLGAGEFRVSEGMALLLSRW